jgi:hypothetical protein
VRVFGGNTLKEEAFLGLAGNDAVAGRLAGFGEIRARVLLGV